MKTLSRRQALQCGGTTLAVAGLTLGFPMTAKADDSELLAMNRKLEAAKVKEDDAGHVYSEAEGAAFKERGPRPEDPDNVYNPETLQWEYQAPEAPEGWGEKVRELNAEYQASLPPDVKERTEEYRRASAAYAEAEKRAEAKHGVEAADRRHQEAMHQRDAIEAELLMMPAATVAGMLLKARIAEGWVDDDGQPEHTAVLGLVADLERLAGRGAS